VEQIIFGIVTGGILLLASVGFSLIWKTEGFLNIAHGQLLLVGAYLAYFFNVPLKLPFILAAILSIVITAFLGLFLAKFVYFPIRKSGILVLLFTSIGLSWMIYGIVQAVAGTKLRGYDLPTGKAWMIGGQPIMSFREFSIIVIALICGIFLHYFFNKTKSGRGVRAMAGNRELAEIRGINSKQLSDRVWLMASGMAGLAGIMLGMTGALNMELGWQQILIIMAVAILGGLGNLYGTMLAAFLIGLVMDLSTLIIPTSYRTTIAFVIIILVLFIRPQGLSKGGKS
jgi:branched-subunit amino acid ABC-type transport system permease component